MSLPKNYRLEQKLESCRYRMRNYDFSDMSPEDWARVGEDTLSWFLRAKPELFEQYWMLMPLRPRHWFELIMSSSKYGEEWECPCWDKFDNSQWINLLGKHQRFISKCPDFYGRFSEVEWCKMLLLNPDLAPYCPIYIDWHGEFEHRRAALEGDIISDLDCSLPPRFECSPLVYQRLNPPWARKQ